MVLFFQNLVNALQWGSFYALIAVGYSMVYGVLMLFNFAHGDIFMVGAYIGFAVSIPLIALDDDCTQVGLREISKKTGTGSAKRRAGSRNLKA